VTRTIIFVVSFQRRPLSNYNANPLTNMSYFFENITCWESVRLNKAKTINLKTVFLVTLLVFLKHLGSALV